MGRIEGADEICLMARPAILFHIPSPASPTSSSPNHASPTSPAPTAFRRRHERPPDLPPPPPPPPPIAPTPPAAGCPYHPPLPTSSARPTTTAASRSPSALWPLTAPSLTVAFTTMVVAAARRFFDWVISGDWMSWWPFWRPGRRLQRLIDDVDADPKDAAKQSALLHELNNFRLQDLLSV